MKSYVSLFSGCGGLDRGLERAGFEPLWFCEKDKSCRKVLAEHWPGRRVIEDVRDVEEGDTSDGGLDLLVGGFPCQDLSYAGKRAGLEGERSGLWHPMARAVRLLQPRLVLVENVPGIMRPMVGGSGIAPIGVVLADLAELGYDARWGRIRAADVGAPHQRSRVFVAAWRRDAVADAVGQRQNGSGGEEREEGTGRRRSTTARPAEVAADSSRGGSARDGGATPRSEEQTGRSQPDIGDIARDTGQDAPHADGGGREFVGESQPGGIEGETRHVADGLGEIGRLIDAQIAADTDGERGKPRKRGRIAGSTHSRARSEERDGGGHPGSTEHGEAVATSPDPDAEGRGELERTGVEGGGEPDSPRSGSGDDGYLETAADTDDPGCIEQRGPESASPQQRSAERGGGEDAVADADGARGRPGEGERGALQGGEVPGQPEVESGGCDRSGGGSEPVDTDWGVFEPAIRRWEALTRPAPRPTDARGRLNPRFSEWMLGFPEGWVDVSGVSRTAQLRMLGNSVQCQVGEAIGRHLAELLEELV